MPLPNPNYVAMFPLQEQLWDKDLNIPLAAGYILFFEDEARTVPKDVFVQTQTPGPTYSYTNIGSQVTLSSIGTTQYLGTDSIIFLFPFDADGNVQLYYIEVFSSTNILQFTRSAWPPGVSGGNSSSGFSQSSNIVSNPQFADVLFNPLFGDTFTVSGTTTTAIAPDWNIITTGNGTFTVNQIALTDDLAPGEPAYALDIVSASINTIILSQRITNSPRILENNFASGTFIVEAIAPTTSAIVTMNYVPSLGATTPIVVGTALPGSFTAYTGTTAAVIPQTNTNAPGPMGYVDIQLVIPVGVHIQISCIQLISVLNATVQADYIQESTPRQIDHLFHYYNPLLQFKPIPSYLVGWDFPLNPAQFLQSTPLNTGAANKSFYLFDQTILFQSANGGVAVTDDTSGAIILTAQAGNQVALIQYLPQTIARDLLSHRLSVNVSAVSSVAHNATISLWYTSNVSVPTITASTYASLVTGLGTNGLPTVVTGWTQVPRLLGDAVFQTNTSATTKFNQYGFSGWDMAGIAAVNTTTFFAIVVGTAEYALNETLTVQSISLVPGDIPTIPAPQTIDEVLRECEYYFETSFYPGTIATATIIGIVTSPMIAILVSGTNVAAYSNSLGFNWKSSKLKEPQVNFYSGTTTTANKVGINLFTIGGGTAGSGEIDYGTFWSAAVTSIYNFHSFPVVSAGPLTSNNTAGNTNNSSASLSYHYVADCRIGVV